MYFIKKAFTLAEVMIVLAILGIVTSITIASTIIKVKDYELKIRWKKTFSTFSNVIESMYVENNMNFGSICNNDEYCAVKEFEKYITIIKNCDTGNTYGDNKCFVSTNELKCIDGTKPNPKWRNDTGFVTKDGMNVVIWMWTDKKIIWGYKNNDDGTRTPLYNTGYKMLFDVNGYKGPNTFGRDIFAANINPQTGTLEPMGMHPERGIEEWFMYENFTGNGCGIEKSTEVLK